MRLIYIRSISALLLFLVQYSALAYLLLSGPLYPGPWYAWVFYLAGWLLGLWSLAVMGPGNLNAAPDVLPEGHLVTRGPYRVIRHPMYAAILLVLIPLVGSDPSIIRISVLILLLLNLLLKIRYEEQKLRNKFLHYKEYSSGTWRLLPPVY